ncbi:MAG: hypothetical protein CBC35_00240 [Planctomycetes bacterium TMED75]|nr:hypothetical protein [Planctomycetaceae bacterium]OUU96959.1 MAG: hypothetical protein CBC35_00240 [Planctomycetes bacterium TMED75]
MNRRVKRRLWLLSILTVACSSAIVLWVIFAAWNRERRVQTSITDGTAAYERGDYVNALNILRYAIIHRKNDHELLLVFADARLRNVDPRGKKGHIQSAIRHYEKVLELNTDNQQALTALFDIYSDSGRFQDALQVAKRLPELNDEMLIKKARIEERSGRVNDALNSIQELRERDTSSSQWAINEFGMRQRSGEDLNENLDVFDTYALAYPENRSIDLIRIILLRELNRNAEARELAMDMANNVEIDPVLLIDLRFQLNRLGLSDQFDEINRRIGEVAETDPELAFNLIQLDWRRGAIDQARMMAIQSSANFPDDLRFPRSAILLDELAPSSDGVQADLAEKLIEESTARDTAGALLDEAIINLVNSLGDDSEVGPQASLGLLARVRALDDSQTYTQFLLIFEGLLLEEMGRTRSAINSYKSSFEATNSRLTGKLLVEAYLRDQEYQQAVDVSKRMSSLFPSVDSTELECRSLLMLAKTGQSTITIDVMINQAGSLTEVVKQNHQLWTNRGENASQLLPILAEAAVIENEREALAYAQEQALTSNQIAPEDLLEIIEVSPAGETAIRERLLQYVTERGGSEFDVVLARVLESGNIVDRVRGLIEVESLARAMPEKSEKRKTAFRKLLVQHAMVPVEWETKIKAISALHAELLTDLPTARFILGIPDIWIRDPKLATQSLELLKTTVGEDSPVYVLTNARRVLQDPEIDPRERALVMVAVDKVIKNSSASIEPCLIMASLLQSGTDPDLVQATIYLRRALDLRPDLVSLYPTAINLLQQTGDGALALDYLKQYRELTIEDEAIARIRATILAKQGDVDNAVSEFDRLITQSDNLMDRIYLGGLLAQVEMNDAAIKQYQIVLDEEPGNILALLRMATTLAAMGRSDEGIEVIQDCETITPEERIRYEILVYRAAGDAPSALTRAEELVELAPNDAKSWLTMYEILLGPENAQRRIQALNQVVAVDPENIDGLTNLAREYMQMQGMVDESRQVIDALSEILPGRSRIMSIKLDAMNPVSGVLEPTTEQLSEAVELIKDMPTNQDANRLAWELHRAAGNHNKALLIAKNAVTSIPASIQPHQWAIESALAARYWDDAIELAEISRAGLAPSDRAMHDLKTAELCLALGYDSRAVRNIERFIPVIGDRDLIFEEAGSTTRVPENFPEMLRMTTLKSLLAADRSDQAIEAFQPLMDQDPEILDLWVLASSTTDPFESSRAIKQVEPMLRSTAEGRMKLVKSLVSIAERSGNNEDIESAMDAIDEIRIDLNQIDQNYMALYEATLLARAEEYEKSIDLLRSVIDGFDARNSNSLSQAAFSEALRESGELDLYVTALNNLAYLYANHRDDEGNEAMEAVTRALKVAPRQFQAPLLDTRALIESKNGNCMTAESTIQEAIKLRPGNISYQMRLAEVLLECDQYDKAEVVSENIQGALLAAPETDIKKLDTITELLDEIRLQRNAAPAGSRS